AEGVAGADRLEGSERERSAQAAHDAGAAADAAPDGGRAAIVQGGGGGAGSADQASGAVGERAADRPPAASASDGDERDA
ncbi:TetR/AcrR family transcriptional regulator, partial [Burkholderia thailandensis]|nr:TetR/AcrR family transcriptional regulator [Burkholderia thailandensis]